MSVEATWNCAVYATCRCFISCGILRYLSFSPAGERGFVRAAAHTMSREITRPDLPAWLSILEVSQETVATHEVVFDRPHGVTKLQ